MRRSTWSPPEDSPKLIFWRPAVRGPQSDPRFSPTRQRRIRDTAQNPILKSEFKGHKDVESPRTPAGRDSPHNDGCDSHRRSGHILAAFPTVHLSKISLSAIGAARGGVNPMQKSYCYLWQLTCQVSTPPSCMSPPSWGYYRLLFPSCGTRHHRYESSYRIRINLQLPLQQRRQSRPGRSINLGVVFHRMRQRVADDCT